MSKKGFLIIDLFILIGIVYSVFQGNLIVAFLAASIFSLKNLQIAKILSDHKKEITPLLEDKLYIVEPTQKVGLEKLSVLDRGQLLDTLEEIQEENYNRFVGVNESMLHTREDIADLLIDILKQHHGVRTNKQVS